jgi:uncharacterized membrane protein
MSSDEPSRPWAWLVLSYLPLLGWIPFVSARRNREVRWHAANGLLLFGALAVIGIVATVVGVMVPALSCVYAVAMGIAGVLYLGIAVLALVKALEGQRLVVPLISRYATRIARGR